MASVLPSLLAGGEEKVDLNIIKVQPRFPAGGDWSRTLSPSKKKSREGEVL